MTAATARPDHSALVLAIDQGGHATRALVFDAAGVEVARAIEPIATTRPAPDRVEHDPDALSDSVTRVIDAVLTAVGPQRHRVTRAGLATQRSSIVCWDRNTTAALSAVLSWQDLRASADLDPLAGEQARIRGITGLRLSGHYGASKLRWCLDQLPRVARALRQDRLAAGPLASFLVHRLLRERPLLVDTANASRTLLCDYRQGEWSDALLRMFGIPRRILPRIVPNAFAYGSLAGLHDELPLSVCTGDQTAALFAAGRPAPGSVLVNVGTGAFVQLVTGDPPTATEGLLEGLAWRDIEGTTIHVLEGTINGAGAAISQVAGALGLSESDVRRDAAHWLREVPDPPLFLNGVSGLAAPFWRPRFASRFIGTGSPPEQLVAVYESVVFLIQSNLDAMATQANPPAALSIAGGLSRIDPFCQRIADLSGLTVSRAPITEATARGLAFLTAGMPAQWPAGSPPTRFVPQPQPALAERYRRWRDALDSASDSDL